MQQSYLETDIHKSNQNLPDSYQVTSGFYLSPFTNDHQIDFKEPITAELPTSCMLPIKTNFQLIKENKS